MQQMTIYDYAAQNQASDDLPEMVYHPLSVGEKIAKVVLGECRIATITKVEGMPLYPFYRTDRGICYSYEDGLQNIDKLIAQAEGVRKNYSTIIPEKLQNRLTVRYDPYGPIRQGGWAQLGTLEINGTHFLYWKELMTYQFLEPYTDRKKLKKEYKKHRENILHDINEIPYTILDEEVPMERLYWSDHAGRFATAEFTSFQEYGIR